MTPCGGANTQCINNADATKTCSCIANYVPTDGVDPENGCSRKLLANVITNYKKEKKLILVIAEFITENKYKYNTGIQYKHCLSIFELSLYIYSKYLVSNINDHLTMFIKNYKILHTKNSFLA